MFWRKKGKESGPQKKAVKKIEGVLWGYMVRQGVIVDILRNWKCVECDVVVENKPTNLTMIRIFDPAAADKKGIDVDDYATLDDHPELILYEGDYHKVGGQATDIRINQKRI
jgi:hypothetical protein